MFSYNFINSHSQASNPGPKGPPCLKKLSSAELFEIEFFKKLCLPPSGMGDILFSPVCVCVCLSVRHKIL